MLRDRRVLFVLCALLSAACKRPPSVLSKATVVAKLPDATVRPLTPPDGASIAVLAAAGAEIALVADEHESALDVVDLARREVVRRIPLDGAPGQVLVDSKGTIFAALRGSGVVVALRLRTDLSAREVARHETGDEPYGLGLSRDGATLYVTSIVDARLESFRTEDLTPGASVDLPRDPRSVVVLKDGRVVVSHATGSTLSVVAPGGSAREVALNVTELRRDFGQMLVTKPMAPRLDDAMFMNGPPPSVRIKMKRSASQGFGLAAIDDEVFLPESVVLTSDGREITSGYGSTEQSTLSTHVPFVARVDVSGGNETLRNPEMSGPSDRACFEGKPSCIVPRAAVADGKNVYIACTDADVIAVHDPSVDYEHAPGCTKARGYQRRIAFDAPTGLALAHLASGDALVAWSELTRRVGIAPLAEADRPIASIELPARAPIAADVARGRELFHRSVNPKIAADGRACASCHVDGREDGLVWPTPKGKRQTPMLAGRLAGTEPYDWNGAHATLAVHIQSTLGNLGGVGLPREDVDALAAYVKSIEPPHKRARQGAEVRRGAEIFRSDEASCSSCHEEGTRFTDGSTHALGAATLGERFDTPSLAFVGQTPPYFHDGRFATLDQLVEQCDGVMGSTRHLSADDKRALVAYLRSL